LLPEIIAFYEERGRTPHIEIAPASASSDLLRALQQHGLFATGVHASFYKPIDSCAKWEEEAEGIRIRELGRDEFEIYGRIHCLGFGLGEDGISPVSANNSVLYDRAGWKFYVALAGEEPVAAGVMCIKNGIASLTLAATLPQYRSRGLHLALIRQRLSEAAVHGCRLAVSQAAYLSASHRNMERAGMQIGYNRVHFSRL
jgi:GNAT superfamily N-acetyltransferase